LAVRTQISGVFLVLKVGLVLLHFHHDQMHVDKLRPCGYRLEWLLSEKLLEAVIILDQLRESRLQKVTARLTFNTFTIAQKKHLVLVKFVMRAEIFFENLSFSCF